MLGKRNWMVLAGMVAVLGLTSCAADSPQVMLKRNDHMVLAAWYKNEAASLRARAEEMRQMAEWYAAARLLSPPPSLTNVSPNQPRLNMVAHCRALAQNYEEAAEENVALSKAHAEQMIRQ